MGFRAAEFRKSISRVASCDCGIGLFATGPASPYIVAQIAEILNLHLTAQKRHRDLHWVDAGKKVHKSLEARRKGMRAVRFPLQSGACKT